MVLLKGWGLDVAEWGSSPGWGGLRIPLCREEGVLLNIEQWNSKLRGQSERYALVLSWLVDWIKEVYIRRAGSFKEICSRCFRCAFWRLSLETFSLRSGIWRTCALLWQQSAQIRPLTGNWIIAHVMETKLGLRHSISSFSFVLRLFFQVACLNLKNPQLQS